MSTRRRVVVVGGGVTGLTAAHRLTTGDTGSGTGTDIEVVVREAGAALGGKIRTSPFAGLPAVDEGPDAFLVRTPDAVRLAERLGLGDGLTHPTGARAAVWHRRLHPVPDGLVLGVPAEIAPFVTTRLLSWRGKARAALEPLLPRTSTAPDSIGEFVRHRFGDEVHERLVDALVGSIYAADTDRFSLAAVPQLAELAGRDRSVLLGARRVRAAGRGAATGPIFAAPRGGMGALVDALATSLAAAPHVEVRTGAPVDTIERDGAGWRVDDEPADAVVLASPARVTAPLVAKVAPEAAHLLGTLDHADVIVVTMAVPGDRWPDRLRGMSGYLVPKDVQRLVTAASFASQKWAHWRPADGSEVLRVSLGRDGLPVDHLDDDAAAAAAIGEVGSHLGVDLAPTAVRVTRWPAAFPQYRPHHARWVAAVRSALPHGIVAGGASFDGIGIPACVRQGNALADDVAGRLGAGAR